MPQGWPDLSNTIVYWLGFSFLSKILRIKAKHTLNSWPLYLKKALASIWIFACFFFSFFRGTSKPVVGYKGTWQKTNILLMPVWLTRPPQCSSKQFCPELIFPRLLSSPRRRWKDKSRNHGNKFAFEINRPFHSCLLSDLAFVWQRG